MKKLARPLPAQRRRHPRDYPFIFSFIGEPNHSSGLPEPDRKAGRGGSEEGELHLHVSVQGTELLFFYFRFESPLC
jgi:hypothetical protein